MAVFESLFDVTYLVTVVALGIRLLLEKREGAALFGLMAILLGLGDGFHLLPRIISHLSPGGFESHAFALSWGQFVTSITMTIFYVLFYYYYRRQSGDINNNKKWLIYILAGLRILLILMPQNNWGQVPGDYMFGIYRNIPFAIMGILLVYWSFQYRKNKGLNSMWWLVLLSFLFYIPVVILSSKYPIVGALMMPKTLAYLFIVILGYRYFIGEFSSINILGMSFTMLIIGLAGGVFYREFTKFYAFGSTGHLGKIHTHILVLGFILTLIIYILSRTYDKKLSLKLKKSFHIYITGLVITIVNMTVIGIWEVVSMGQATINIKILEGLSGFGHLVLATGLIKILLNLYEGERGRFLE